MLFRKFNNHYTYLGNFSSALFSQMVNKKIFIPIRHVWFAEKDRRTVSIEVGMQNSALGVVLATAHFADPLVAVPCAISATVHSCVGSLVAGAWRLRDEKKTR